MPNWKKLLTSGSDASLNSLHVDGSVNATSLTGSLSFDNLTGVPTFISSSEQVTLSSANGFSTLATTGSNQFNGTQYISGSLIPGANEAYDLGSITSRWRDLYLSGSTIVLGDTKITTDASGNVEFKDRATDTRKVLKVDELEIGSGASARKIKVDNGRVSFTDRDDNIQSTKVGHILPSATNTYDLGSPTEQFRHIYMSSASLYVDGTKVLSSDSNTLTFTTDLGQSIKILETGGDDITLQTGTGNIELKGTVEIESGKKITDSAGTIIQFGNSIGITGSIAVSGTVDGIDLQTMSSSLDSRINNISTDFADITNKPSLISSSAQITITESQISDLDHYTNSDNLSYLNSLGVLSGSITSAKIADVDAFSQSGTYANLRAQATTKADVGLGNVTNESKATMFTNAALTGNPTAPTQTGTDDSTKIATTAFVQGRIDAIIGTAGSTLDTLGELSASLASDQSALTSLTTTVGTKLAKSSNLSDLTNAATARINLGLGTAATTAATDYATSAQGSRADTAHGWGNHATAGYLTSQTSHADVVVDGDFTSNGLMKRTGAGTYAIVTDNSSNWNTAYGWGNHASAGYLTSLGTALVDADFSSNGLMKRTAAGTYAIVTDNSSNWNTAYGWGNHASAGYLTTETYTAHEDTSTLSGLYGGSNNGIVIEDITVDSNGHITAIGTRDLDGRFATTAQGSNADTAFGWGNHASAGYLTSLPSHNHDDRYLVKSSIGVNTGEPRFAYTTYTDPNPGTTRDAKFGDDGIAATEVYSSGLVIASGGNSSQWNTAYSWGNHASAGYLTSVAEANLPTANTIGAGTYGSTSDAVKIDEITVDAYGRITGITTGATGDIGAVRLNTDDALYVQDTSGTSILTMTGTNGISTSKVDGTTLAIGISRPTSGNWFTGTPSIGGDGVMEIGKYIDFHDSDTETSDYSYRMTATNTNMAFSGTITAAGYNSSNWDTAHGWGDHASAGYLTSLPSHNHDDRYYTESEIQQFFDRGYLNSHDAGNLAEGWYTIAANAGDRALGTFQIWDTASSDHQSVIFNASHHFGNDSSNDITVLANSRYSGTNFRYIRIKEGGTYDGAALQVYIDGSSNSVSVAIVGGNAQSGGWVLKDWVADATDPGTVANYSALSARVTIDLDKIVDGGILTSGKYYGYDTITSESDIIAYSTSDRRFKDNLKPIQNATDKVKKLTGYEFDWNDKQNIYVGHDVGVVAQEVEEVLPEIVTTRDNGYKAVKYEKLTALLIEAVKDQQKQIEKLTQEINDLRRS